MFNPAHTKKKSLEYINHNILEYINGFSTRLSTGEIWAGARCLDLAPHLGEMWPKWRESKTENWQC